MPKFSQYQHTHVQSRHTFQNKSCWQKTKTGLFGPWEHTLAAVGFLGKREGAELEKGLRTLAFTTQLSYSMGNDRRQKTIVDTIGREPKTYTIHKRKCFSLTQVITTEDHLSHNMSLWHEAFKRKRSKHYKVNICKSLHLAHAFPNTLQSAFKKYVHYRILSWNITIPGNWTQSMASSYRNSVLNNYRTYCKDQRPLCIPD